MERPANLGYDEAASAKRRCRSASTASVERRIVDLLPDSFTLSRSESEWLLTLLSADELRFIFEGPTNGTTQN